MGSGEGSNTFGNLLGSLDGVIGHEFDSLVGFCVLIGFNSLVDELVGYDNIVDVLVGLGDTTATSSGTIDGNDNPEMTFFLGLILVFLLILEPCFKIIYIQWRLFISILFNSSHLETQRFKFSVNFRRVKHSLLFSPC